MESILTASNYKKVLLIKPLTEDQIKMLKLNYDSKNEAITATQMSKQMGWENHGSANLHYGKLGRMIGERIGYQNDNAEYLFSIVTFEKPDKEWYWILRKELITALLDMKIIKPKCEYEMDDDVSKEDFYEGAKKRIEVNFYERDRNAREACLKYYGNSCAICGFNFRDSYGDFASDIIHVHHIKPLSEIDAQYKVDPIKDLIPLCPNCHAVIHMVNPPLSIDELKMIIRKKDS